MMIPFVPFGSSIGVFNCCYVLLIHWFNIIIFLIDRMPFWGYIRLYTSFLEKTYHVISDMIFHYILYILLSPSWFVSFPCLLSLLNPYGRKRIHDDPCGIRFQNTDLSLGLQCGAPPSLRTQQIVRVINIFLANIKSTCCIILVGSITIFVGKMSDFAGSPANLGHHRLPKTARVPACHGGVFLHLPGF
jgi:hypothetical protein